MTTPHSDNPAGDRPVWALQERAFWEKVRQVVSEVLSEITTEAGESLMDLQQAARLCSCSVRQLHRLRLEGLPTIWVGDSSRFERDAILAWLQTRKVSK